MSDLAILLAQLVLTACLAAWMVVAVLGNWRFPALNQEGVAMVMRFDLMKETYPDDFAIVQHRKVENPKVIRILFRLMVFSETIAALLLLLGTVLLFASLVGGFPLETARFMALLGALWFTVNWTGFLIGGEYFCYWYCHFGSQATHMMLAIWGTLVCGLLVVS